MASRAGEAKVNYMLTITTEIHGKVTATITDDINGRFGMYVRIGNEDPFQSYPAGYLALKHDGWRKVDLLELSDSHDNLLQWEMPEEWIDVPLADNRCAYCKGGCYRCFGE